MEFNLEEEYKTIKQLYSLTMNLFKDGDKEYVDFYYETLVEIKNRYDDIRFDDFFDSMSEREKEFITQMRAKLIEGLSYFKLEKSKPFVRFSQNYFPYEEIANNFIGLEKILN